MPIAKSVFSTEYVPSHRYLILTLCAIAIYFYLSLFTFNGTPFLLGGDQAYFWMDGMRLLDGQHIYQDFFRYTPPGTDLLYAALFKILAPRVWVTNLTIFALGLGFAWLCFSLSNKFMSGELACFTTALFSVFVYGKALNGTNHWFAVLAIAGAVNVLMDKISQTRLAAAGTLLAVAAFFNQAHGAAALLGISVFLFCRHFHTSNRPMVTVRDMGLLFMGFGLAFLLLNAFFIRNIGLERLWYYQVIYVLKYPIHPFGGWSLGLPETLTWKNALQLAPYLLTYILLPTTYCAAFWLGWAQRRDPSFPWERVLLLSSVGFFLLAEVAVAVNWLRLYAVSLPGIILCVWMLAPRLQIKSYTAMFVWVFIFGLAARQVIASHRSNSVEVQFAGGHFATTPQNYEKLGWIAQLTKPGELFLQAGWPGVYLPLHLRNPLYVATVSTFDAPREEDIALAVQQMKSKPVRYVLWTGSLDWRCNQDHPCSDALAPLRNYIHSSYTCVHAFHDGDVLWQRNNSSPSESHP